MLPTRATLDNGIDIELYDNRIRIKDYLSKFNIDTDNVSDELVDIADALKEITQYEAPYQCLLDLYAKMKNARHDELLKEEIGILEQRIFSLEQQLPDEDDEHDAPEMFTSREIDITDTEHVAEFLKRVYDKEDIDEHTLDVINGILDKHSNNVNAFLDDVLKKTGPNNPITCDAATLSAILYAYNIELDEQEQQRLRERNREIQELIDAHVAEINELIRVHNNERMDLIAQLNAARNDLIMLNDSLENIIVRYGMIRRGSPIDTIRRYIDGLGRTGKTADKQIDAVKRSLLHVIRKNHIAPPIDSNDIRELTDCIHRHIQALEHNFNIVWDYAASIYPALDMDADGTTIKNVIENRITDITNERIVLNNRLEDIYNKLEAADYDTALAHINSYNRLYADMSTLYYDITKTNLKAIDLDEGIGKITTAVESLITRYASIMTSLNDILEVCGIEPIVKEKEITLKLNALKDKIKKGIGDTNELYEALKPYREQYVIAQLENIKESTDTVCNDIKFIINERVKRIMADYNSGKLIPGKDNSKIKIAQKTSNFNNAVTELYNEFNGYNIVIERIIRNTNNAYTEDDIRKCNVNLVTSHKAYLRAIKTRAEHAYSFVKDASFKNDLSTCIATLNVPIILMWHADLKAVIPYINMLQNKITSLMTVRNDFNNITMALDFPVNTPANIVMNRVAELLTYKNKMHDNITKIHDTYVPSTGAHPDTDEEMLTAIHARLQSLNTENKDYVNRVDNLNNELKNKQTELDVINKALEDVYLMFGVPSGDNDGLQDILNKAQENNIFMEQLATALGKDANADAALLLNSINQLITEKRTLESEINVLKTKVTNFKNKRNALNDQLTAVTKERDDLNNQLAEVKNERDKLERKITTTESDIADIEKRFTKINALYDNLNAEMIKNRANNESLLKRIEQLNTDISNASTALENERETAQTQIDKYKADISMLESRIKNNDDEYNKLRNQYDVTARELSDLRNEYSEANKTVVNLQEVLDKEINECVDLDIKYQEANNKVERLQNELSTLRNQRSEAKKEIGMQQSNIISLTNDLDRIRTFLNIPNADVNAVIAKLEEIKKCAERNVSAVADNNMHTEHIATIDRILSALHPESFDKNRDAPLKEKIDAIMLIIKQFRTLVDNNTELENKISNLQAAFRIQMTKLLRKYSDLSNEITVSAVEEFGKELDELLTTKFTKELYNQKLKESYAKLLKIIDKGITPSTDNDITSENRYDKNKYVSNIILKIRNTRKSVFVKEVMPFLQSFLYITRLVESLNNPIDHVKGGLQTDYYPRTSANHKIHIAEIDNVDTETLKTQYNNFINFVHNATDEAECLALSKFVKPVVKICKDVLQTAVNTKHIKNNKRRCIHRLLWIFSNDG